MGRSPTQATDYSKSVFINCPFDADYEPLFRSIVFSVVACGYVARCAREIEDGSEVRISKIYRIIKECQFGIHDISRAGTDKKTKLARFNMPFELGIFLGAKEYGGKLHKSKRSLTLDVESFRYRKFLSDIGGQDIRAHSNDPLKTVGIIRNWLSPPQNPLPGGSEFCDHYNKFLADLPALCNGMRIKDEDIKFNDLTYIISGWLKTKPILFTP